MATRTVSRRDLILLFLGALCMHLFSLAFLHSSELPDVPIEPTLNNVDQQFDVVPQPTVTVTVTVDNAKPALAPLPPAKPPPRPKPTATAHIDITSATTLPETTIVQHAPGWTIFENLYMAAGTLYIVSSHPVSYFPAIRLMTSTGLEANGDPDNERLREPTPENLHFLTPAEAHTRWGGDPKKGEPNRVLSVEGNTFLFNDPKQFLRHYYHFVAELWFGAWAFWSGTFSDSKTAAPFASQISANSYNLPPVDRIIFAHSNADGWRDNPGFNAYFLRASFPSITVEHEEDWKDRVVVTSPPPSRYTFNNPDPNPEETRTQLRKASRAWHFPLVLLADRSAAFRGASCGSRTQRTASEAFEHMNSTGKLSQQWWEPVRTSILRFAGAEEHLVDEAAQVPLDKSHHDDVAAQLPMPKKVVVTYLSRQSTRRKLVPQDHDVLVSSLKELAERKNWELNVVQAENLTKDEQVRIIARTTILLGVHGNGLTHLVLLPKTKITTVIEMFFPGGFAHDYEWTTRAMSFKHFAVWNDTHHTFPDEPRVDYPEGFQGPAIPVHGPTVAQLIEDRVEGRV